MIFVFQEMNYNIIILKD